MISMSSFGAGKAGGWHARLGAGLLCLALLSVNAAADSGDARDPIEGVNRAMFAVHETLDTVAIKPLGKAYDAALPLPAKVGVGNVFGTVGDAWIGVNNLLQGKPGQAASDVGRVLVNLTLGIFGLFDVASELGLEKHDEDLGQTLAVWGVGDGPYLFLPVVGPRNARDFAGLVGGMYVDPVSGIGHVPTRNALRGLRIVDLRASLLPADKVVEEAALDKYSYIRNAYYQQRRNQIYDGRPPRIDDDY